jgi:hypothetical protein
VYGRIAQRPEDPAVDKDELKETVARLQQEAAKGDQASSPKANRWLDFLKQNAPDVFELAVNALTNPGAAVANAVKIAADAFKTAQAPAETNS